MLNSIRNRLTLTYIGLVIGPLLLVGGVLARQSFTVQEQQALSLQREVAQRVATQVQAELGQRQSELELVAKILNLRSLPRADQENTLSRLQSDQDMYQELAFVDSGGQELARVSRLHVSAGAQPADLSAEPAFREPLATGQPYFSPVWSDPDNPEPLMTIGVPLEDVRTGRVAGVLIADVRLALIWSSIQNLPSGPGESVYMVDETGRVVAHRNSSIVVREDRLADSREEGIRAGLGGGRVVLAVHPFQLGTQAFAVVAEQPVSTALALANYTVLITTAVILGGLLVAGALVVIAVRHFVGPIQDLVTASQAIRAGDLSQQARTSGLKELDELARAFNSMTAQLRVTLEDLKQRVAERQRAEEALTEERNLLRTLIDNLPDHIFVKDTQGRFVINNRAHPPPGGPDGADSQPAEPASSNGSDARVLTRGEAILDQEESYTDASGGLRWQSTTKVPLRDSHGRVIGLVGMIRDITERKRREVAERRLEEHRRSPSGQAELLAQALLAHPATALIELHGLALRAGQEPATAAVLEHLPQVLDGLGTPLLTGLAGGYAYIVASQFTPELLGAGLRQLSSQLASPAARQLEGAGAARSLYASCQAALEASSIPQIVQLMAQVAAPGGRPGPAASEPAADGQPFLADLDRALRELAFAAEALHAYERVDTPSDKLAYLAGAVERLRHAERLARTGLGAADGPIVQRLAENWLAIVTAAMSELQTRASLVCRLLTRRSWQGDVITLALSVRNEGRGAALNLSVSLSAAPEYTLLDDVAHVERLGTGEETHLELRVRPRLAAGQLQLRARFGLVYDDPRGPGQTESFADVVYLLAPETEFRFIPNPYVVGTPLQTGSPLFFGREDIFTFVLENLSAVHQHNLVLIGQRRTGKTSLLKQLPARLGEAYVPVYLDGQSLALDPGLPSFFFGLATEIAFALEDRGLSFEPPAFGDFAEASAIYFQRRFLARVRETIGRRHLLLLLDEFEELEAAARRGSLDDSVFGFLRHLIQHSPDLSVIFCGTHRLEELAADYWSVLFNISLYRHVGFLEQAEALRLIQEPVSEFGMRYDDLALDKIWRVTAGQPYFLQLLCHSLVNQHNRSGRSYVTVADVNAALDDILAAGEAHFVYLWTESSGDERLVLTALSRMMPLTGQATPVLVADYLAERGIGLERRAVAQALHQLALRDTLVVKAEMDEGPESAAGAAYGWRLGLLGLWVEKYKSLSRVVEDVQEL